MPIFNLKPHTNIHLVSVTRYRVHHGDIEGLDKPSVILSYMLDVAQHILVLAGCCSV